VKGGLERAGLRIGEGPEMFQGRLEDFVRETRHADIRLLPHGDATGKMLGHFGDGVDRAEIDDGEKRVVGTDRLARCDLQSGDDSGDGRGEDDLGRRITRLAAFEDDEFVARFYDLIGFHIHFHGASGDATADDMAFAGKDLDPSEREHGLLEVGLQSFARLETQVFHPRLVEDDHVAFRAFLGGESDAKQEKCGGKNGERKFHG